MQAKLSEQDIYFGFKLIGVECNLADARLFVSRYDEDGDFRLNFSEFQKAILPLSPLHREDLERRSRLDNAIAGQVSLMTSMTIETFEAFKRVVRRSLELELYVERIRQDTACKEVQTLHGAALPIDGVGIWSKRAAFDQMDWLGKGFITSMEVHQAMESLADPPYANSALASHQGSFSSFRSAGPNVMAGTRLEPASIELLVRRFNKNKEHGRITVKEFIDEVTPKCPMRHY